jgi:hypothetical protein
MKNYFKILFIGLFSSILFYACTKNEDQILSDKVVENSTLKTTMSSRAVLGTCCYINGTTLTTQTLANLCAPNAQAIVNAGTTATYQYVNNTGNASIINWTISANPIGSATLISNGSTVTVNYLTSFISGTLSVAGSGGTAQTCNTVLNITTPSVTCCSPTFDAFYICDGTVKGKGAVVPFSQGCNVSTISKIVWNLGGAKWIAGPLAGQGGGTMLPPFNQYVKNIGYYQCQYGMFRISATYYFNNGCPPSTYNLDVTPTN